MLVAGPRRRQHVGRGLPRESHAGLVAGAAHERRPLRSVRATAGAVQEVHGDVGHFVAEDFAVEVGVSGGEGGGEADFAAGGGAAAEGAAQAGGVVHGDARGEGGEVPGVGEGAEVGADEGVGGRSSRRPG